MIPVHQFFFGGGGEGSKMGWFFLVYIRLLVSVIKMGWFFLGALYNSIIWILESTLRLIGILLYRRNVQCVWLPFFLHISCPLNV